MSKKFFTIFGFRIFSPSFRKHGKLNLKLFEGMIQQI